MLENICIENVCTVLEAADKLNAPILRGECMKFILSHPGEVSNVTDNTSYELW